MATELEMLKDAIEGTLRGFKRLNPSLKRAEMLDTLIDLAVKFGEEKEHLRKIESWGRKEKEN